MTSADETPQAEARAARAGAALFSRGDAGLVEVTGADRVRWLDGMLSNDVTGLAAGSAGSGCPALLLTRQGRIVADPHTTVTDLLDAAVAVAHAVTRDAVRLTGRWYESRLVDGLSDGQYVEIVGTVVALVSIDQFCRAVAVPEHPLPAPLPRAPTRYRRPCLTAP